MKKNRLTKYWYTGKKVLSNYLLWNSDMINETYLSLLKNNRKLKNDKTTTSLKRKKTKFTNQRMSLFEMGIIYKKYILFTTIIWNTFLQIIQGQ